MLLHRFPETFLTSNVSQQFRGIKNLEQIRRRVLKGSRDSQTRLPTPFKQNLSPLIFPNLRLNWKGQLSGNGTSIVERTRLWE